MNKKILIAVMAIVYFLTSHHIMAQDEVLTPQQKKGKWGYVNGEGKKIIAFKYNNAEKFSEGLAAVQDKNGKWGYIDELGKIVIPFVYKSTYDEAKNFHKGVALVNTDSGYCFIDKARQVVSPLYDKVYPFFNGDLAKVDLDKKQGFIDGRGKLITILYDKVGDFSEGLARVLLDNKIGCVDETGKEVIPCKYDQIGGFSTNIEGLAVFQSGEKAGFISKDGIESEMKSSKAELPAKFKSAGTEIIVKDLKIGKKSGNTFVTLYGTGLNVIPLSFNGSGDYSKMINASIITNDGNEYKAVSLATGLLSFSLYFNTSLDPQFIFLYMGNDPDNKIQIDFK